MEKSTDFECEDNMGLTRPVFGEGTPSGRIAASLVQDFSGIPCRSSLCYLREENSTQAEAELEIHAV